MFVKLKKIYVEVFKLTSIRVVNPGMYTTIQDFGRTAYQQYGMPVSGSMDQYAHRLANLLVGNDESEAILEMTILGGTYSFNKETFIAITGSNMNPILNGITQVGMWRTVFVNKGDQIFFNAAKDGCRCYLAVAGGYDIPTVLASKSTYVRGKLGGFEGRPLKKEDVISLNKNIKYQKDLVGRFIKADYIFKYDTTIELRVILGPQEDAFSRKGIADFFSESYRVSNEFDRMGYRLEGKKIEHLSSSDIISDGIVKGAVQIPGHGNPIIMLADCQTTGGYTKIAHVISSDLWKIAQAKAGDYIRFRAVDIKESHEILKEQEQMITEIISDFKVKRLQEDKDIKLNINNKSYTVKINEIKGV